MTSHAGQVDVIKISNIQCYGFHGALPEERRLGQRFIVSIELEVDTRLAAASDELCHTVNYAEVIQLIESQLTGPPVHLLETLAQRIVARVLGTFIGVKAVTIEVTKPSAPISTTFEGVTVKIRRERA